MGPLIQTPEGESVLNVGVGGVPRGEWLLLVNLAVLSGMGER